MYYTPLIQQRRPASLSIYILLLCEFTTAVEGVPGAGRSAGLSLHILYTTYTLLLYTNVYRSAGLPLSLSIYTHTTSLRIYYCFKSSTCSSIAGLPLSLYIHYFANLLLLYYSAGLPLCLYIAVYMYIEALLLLYYCFTTARGLPSATEAGELKQL